MYQYILFDLDGTLTDPKIGITSCVQYALKKLGIDEPDLDKLEPFIGPPLLDSFQDFYGFDEETGFLAISYYRERFRTIGIFENEIYAGIPELLEKLKDSGRRLAIASSKPIEFVERILKYFEIDRYFDVVVGSELDGTRGRKEEVVEEALKRLWGIEDIAVAEVTSGREDLRVQTVMVGDRKFDIAGAKVFRISSIGVSYGYAQQGELEKAGADVVVGSVEELGRVLA